MRRDKSLRWRIESRDPLVRLEDALLLGHIEIEQQLSEVVRRLEKIAMEDMCEEVRIAARTALEAIQHETNLPVRRDGSQEER